jgi:hypothetical protein
MFSSLALSLNALNDVVCELLEDMKARLIVRNPLSEHTEIFRLFSIDGVLMAGRGT